MGEFITLAEIDEAAALIRSRTRYQPTLGLILGSGLGALVDAVEKPDIISTAEIPHFPVSTVAGHGGKLFIGTLEGRQVLVLQGRTHFYEGYSMSQIGLPVRVMKRLGINTMVVTNAAGAINPDYIPGDLMLIKDHIALIGMAGANPLRGPNLDEFGPRFPDMSQAYDRQLLDASGQFAEDNGLHVHRGVYVGLAGPSFEIPADLRFLRIIGADAVGMSTVPEVIVARHSGMRVLGISGISNKANLDGNTITTHEEVLEAGRIIVPKLIRVIRGVLPTL